MRHETDLSGPAIRRAAAADQPVIRAIVRAAGVNPLGLAWPRFLVAELDGQIVGIGQVKQHRDGSRELASIAVLPEWRRQGVAAQIIYALLAREPGPLYLVCRPELGVFYEQFGFRPAAGSALPRYFHRLTRLVGLLQVLARGLRLSPPQMLVMCRQPVAPRESEAPPPV